MPIPFKEKIGVLINWAAVVHEAVQQNDYERFKNAAEKDFSGAVQEAIFSPNGPSICAIAKTGNRQMLKLAFEVVNNNEKVSQQITRSAYELFTDRSLNKECADLLVSKLSSHDLESCMVDILASNNIDFLALFIRNHNITQSALNAAFVTAAGVCNEDKLALLYEKGAEIEGRRPMEERTALLNAACNSPSEKSLACVRRLLQWGADPNFVAASGHTAMSLAANLDNKPVIAELLNFKAVDTNGKAKLAAAARHPDDKELMKMLTDAEKGILPEKQDGGSTDMWRQLYAEKAARTNDDKGQMPQGFI